MNIGKITLTNINKGDAIHYLGFGNADPDASTLALLDKCEKELLSSLDCKYIYRVFPLENGQIPGSSFRLRGNAIAGHLKGCRKIILLCATLSEGADRLIRKKQLLGMAEAMITDALASAAIEQVCDEAEREIMKSFPGTGHTWRFGLGYGDFPLDQQAAFLSILDAPKRIGVCSSSSFLLTPLKSVTCVIGLGEDIPTRNKKKCANCSLRGTCPYRRTDLCSSC
ncbi:MAG: methionine synthase [Lachnospiraceae bacterium]|nr:methionine synthase [Lachnospiraceae bacterium]